MASALMNLVQLWLPDKMSSPRGRLMRGHPAQEDSWQLMASEGNDVTFLSGRATAKLPMLG